MPTGRAPAPLTHDAFRQRQKSVELDGLSYKPLRVAYTDVGDGVIQSSCCMEFPPGRFSIMR